MRIEIWLGIALLALAGCVQMAKIEDARPVSLSASQVAQIKSVVTRDFNDPASAQFRNIRATDVILEGGKRERRVCGEVNGKNLYGAYVGFSLFGGTLENGVFQRRTLSAPCEPW